LKNIALILCGLLITGLLSILGDLVRLQTFANQLHLDEIAECLDFVNDDNFKAETYFFLTSFINDSIPEAYKKVYQQLSEKTGDPVRAKAAAAALMLAIKNIEMSSDNRKICNRLLMKYLGENNLTMASALSLHKLQLQHQFFSNNNEEADHFMKYLRQVWAAEIKSEVSEAKKLTDKAQSFLQHFPSFIDETTLLTAVEKPEDRWEYFLIEGRTGENEDDFELRKL